MFQFLERNDYEVLVKIDKCVFSENKERYDRQPWDVENFKRQLPCKHELSVVVMYECEIVGFSIAYSIQDHWSHITRVAVHPRLVSRRIGETMIHHQLEIMRSSSFNFVTLELNGNNSAAERFYKKMGFLRLTDEELGEYLSQRQRSKKEYSSVPVSRYVLAIRLRKY